MEASRCAYKRNIMLCWRTLFNIT